MKNIIITGANGGIGQYACNHFKSLNYQVIAIDIVFDECMNIYDCYKLDLKNEESVKTAIEEIVKKYETIDCLYNIAGGSGRRFGDGPIDTCTLDGFNETINMNLTTTFLMCKYVTQQMLKQNSGSIVNTASVLGMRGGGEMFATHTYAACKAAIIGMSKAMASQYAKNNIRVNVIAPGLIQTPMSLRAQQDEAILNYMDYKQPIYKNKHQLGEPKSLVKAAEFLFDDSSDFVTGIVVPVDGGWSAI